MTGKQSKTAEPNPRNTAPLLFGLALLLVVVGVIVFTRLSTPVPPEVPDPDRSRMEPRVSEKIQNFREGVFDVPDSSDAWGDLGVVLHAHGLEEEAAACYQNAIELDPSDFRWRYLLVHAFLAYDRDAAFQASGEAMDVRADYPALLVARAEMLEEDGAIDEALPLYEQALELDPKNASAEFALGRMAMSDGDVDKARVHLERASELSPDAGAILASLARVYRRLGDTDKAVEIAGRVTTASPSIPVGDPIHLQMLRESVSSTAELGRARAFAEEGNLNGAEAIYRELVSLRPDDAAMRVRLADVLLRQNGVDEAKEHYRAALEIKPDDPGGLAGLAAVFGREGAYDEAVAHFEQSLAARADHVPTLLSYAAVIALQGRTDDAMKQFEEAIAIEPDNVAARRALADFFFRSSRYHEASERYREALAIEPDLGVVHLQLGASLAATGSYQDAESHLARARELGQVVPDAVAERVRRGLSR